jgi:DNA topoisomerase-1
MATLLTTGVDVPYESIAAARRAGLLWVTDAEPGITRRRAGKSFSYRDRDGRIVRDPEELLRIRSLAIPPAWERVWICPIPRGHIQATGRDARRRKQYRYHPDWRAVRDEHKYGRLIAFGQALPALREHVDEDLARRGLPRERVLGAAVRLLDSTLIRIGNREYARQNAHFGLTTLQDEHVEVKGAVMHFHFKGKGGKEHDVVFADPRLAAVVKRCQDLPGQHLFQYVDDDGRRAGIESSDVNDYLREIAGQEFTAKDFRTWGGTVLAAETLYEIGPFSSAAEAKRNVTAAIKKISQHLRNTPAVCRACYVHPGVLESYAHGTLLQAWKAGLAAEARRERSRHLDPEEAVVLSLLKQLEAQQRPS